MDMDQDRWRQHMLNEIKEIRRTLVKVEVDIAMLKIKAGLWGAVAGAIPIAVLYFAR